MEGGTAVSGGVGRDGRAHKDVSAVHGRARIHVLGQQSGTGVHRHHYRGLGGLPLHWAGTRTLWAGERLHVAKLPLKLFTPLLLQCNIELLCGNGAQVLNAAMAQDALTPPKIIFRGMLKFHARSAILEHFFAKFWLVFYKAKFPFSASLRSREERHNRRPLSTACTIVKYSALSCTVGDLYLRRDTVYSHAEL